MLINKSEYRTRILRLATVATRIARVGATEPGPSLNSCVIPRLAGRRFGIGIRQDFLRRKAKFSEFRTNSSNNRSFVLLARHTVFGTSSYVYTSVCSTSCDGNELLAVAHWALALALALACALSALDAI